MDQTTIGLVEASYLAGQKMLSERPASKRKSLGQFLTPPRLACYIAEKLGEIPSGSRILDPAVGSGVLLAAIIERLIQQGHPGEYWLEGYEVDPTLLDAARETLSKARDYAAAIGITFHLELHECDFVLQATDALYPNLFSSGDSLITSYDFIIANPPYYKLNVSDQHAKAAKQRFEGHTNIYTLFMAISTQLLLPNGKAIFIVPRSFCSGAYFSKFRQQLISLTYPLSVHVFESRKDAFQQDEVLQENIIFTFQKRLPDKTELPEHVLISASDNLSDLQTARTIPVKMAHFLKERGNKLYFRLPVTTLDERIIEVVDGWSGSLGEFRMKVSTGPVVPFRTREFLLPPEAVDTHHAVPLYWMENIHPQQTIWPVKNGKNKPQAFVVADGQPHLVPNGNYVLLRRFSAKEERRRLIAAPFLQKDFRHDWLGLENHLNYIYRQQGELSEDETIGLAALLNCGLLDRYIRISNGNTQVNATELRTLRLPPLEIIRHIGQALRKDQSADLDLLVIEVLKSSQQIPKDFPVLRETRTL